MPNIVAAELDLLSESQADKAGTANNLFDALSSAAMFGVKSLTGLVLELYGGNMVIAGVPTVIANQTLNLTDDATNYIYSTSAGVFTKVTSAPTGWPGPITSPADAIALYRLVTIDGFVSNDSADRDVYVPSLGSPGLQGDAGAQGDPGVDLASQRIRFFQHVGANVTTTATVGFSIATAGVTGTARALATTNFLTTIPYAAYLTAASANSQGQLYNDKAFCYRGDAAGRGGFTLGIRFALESANSPANFRCLFGLMPPGTGTIGNVEPDTLTNIVGVGSKTGEANLSVIHNDASGTATMTTLGANFPARAADSVYELVLTAAANASTIDYSLLNAETGNTATGTLSTNLPVNTTFLGWVTWCANGGTASAAAFGLMQIVGSTRW